MRRSILAVLAAIALLGVTGLTTVAQSVSCISTTIGDYTTVNCVGSDGSFGSGSSIQIGESSFGNYQITPAIQPIRRRSAPVSASDNCYDWANSRFIVGC